MTPESRCVLPVPVRRVNNKFWEQTRSLIFECSITGILKDSFEREVVEISKPTYQVEIAGLPLKLRSSHDEATVRELADIVNKKVNEAMGRGRQPSFQNALLLAALHLAEELVLLKRSARRELDDIEHETLQILSELKLVPNHSAPLDV